MHHAVKGQIMVFAVDLQLCAEKFAFARVERDLPKRLFVVKDEGGETELRV